MKPDTFEWTFNPVGQGLFFSGILRSRGHARPQFTWVYDCGTISDHKLLEAAVNAFVKACGHKEDGRPRLDLLVISHFDRDHVNGVPELLNHFEVGTILLPYLPLAERILLALEAEGEQEMEWLSFLTDPVSYLRSRPNAQIERVLFVHASSEQGIGEGIAGDTIRVPSASEDWELVAGPTLPSSTASDSGARPEDMADQLRPHATVKLGEFLEFLPYNDRPMRTIPSAFIEAAEKERKILANPKLAKDALQRLRQLYDLHFGSTGQLRNRISQILLCVPLAATGQWAWMQEITCGDQSFPVFSLCVGRFLNGGGFKHDIRPLMRCSLLLTGDACVRNSDELDRLTNHLGENRMKNLGAMQVMHHGSQHSCGDDVADKLAPFCSVFCSDPGLPPHHHPHPNVLRQFWPYHPVQADKVNSVVMRGLFISAAESSARTMIEVMGKEGLPMVAQRVLNEKNVSIGISKALLHINSIESDGPEVRMLAFLNVLRSFYYAVGEERRSAGSMATHKRDHQTGSLPSPQDSMAVQS